MIPAFNCIQCHKCCGPIAWFKPENENIKQYLKKNKIKRFLWTIDQFEKNDMKCPYLIDNKCLIYPVRPIVCRLQGNIIELECKTLKNNKFISKNELDIIKKEFLKLIEQTNGLDSFYSTLKL